MGLRACSECGHPVTDDDAACPSCGAAVTRRSPLLWIALAAVGLLVTGAIFVAMFRPGTIPRRAAEKLSPVVAAQQTLDQALSDGVVTKVQGSVIWVEPTLWRLRSAAEKAALASACATFGAGDRAGADLVCEVKDNRNSKVIATWSPASGLAPRP